MAEAQGRPEPSLTWGSEKTTNPLKVVSQRQGDRGAKDRLLQGPLARGRNRSAENG